jgi:cation transport regulator
MPLATVAELVDGHARNLGYQHFGHSANLRVPLPAQRRLRGALRPTKCLGLGPKDDAMSSRQITQLADNVKNNLPKYDKEVYKEAFNSAEDQYGEEDRAHRVAWSAVEQKYEKNEKGN